ncbi:hypothetical protein CCH79_00015455 [Gambusia affinis]|uniref:Uncharacterized protein n=1 Tax=Gambusia affinis TaxID=33528 RepID=A0A315VNX4_GAMAF|nr:hypothetical protein CCH79_00015455 [Gambusia affinis]
MMGETEAVEIDDILDDWFIDSLKSVCINQPDTEKQPSNAGAHATVTSSGCLGDRRLSTRGRIPLVEVRPEAERMSEYLRGKRCRHSSWRGTPSHSQTLRSSEEEVQASTESVESLSCAELGQLDAAALSSMKDLRRRGESSCDPAAALRNARPRETSCFPDHIWHRKRPLDDLSGMFQLNISLEQNQIGSDLRFSRSSPGLSGLVQIYDTAGWRAELQDASPLFQHAGHSVSSQHGDGSAPIFITTHVWHPERPRTLLSAASDGSVHVWDWAKPLRCRLVRINGLNHDLNRRVCPIPALSFLPTTSKENTTQSLRNSEPDVAPGAKARPPGAYQHASPPGLAPDTLSSNTDRIIQGASKSGAAEQQVWESGGQPASAGNY